jgi:cytochrome P450
MYRMLSFAPANFGPEFYADPYPTYRMLREQDPVHLCPDGTWFLTKYANLERIYRDRRSFSSDKKAVFAPKFGAHSPLYEHHTSSLVFNDPPYHTRVRRAIVGALTPHVLKDMAAGLVPIIDRLLTQIEIKYEFDAIEDFAAAIPVEVIGNLLGVPQAERGPLREWSLAILGALEPVLTPEQQQRGNAAVTDFLAYLRTLIAQRRRNLADDDTMLARLIREERAAEPISETELLHNSVFLLNAGHETTTNLIGNALHLLLTHEDQLQRLRADPALINPAVEECLRCESPNQLGNRLVVEPVQVADTLLQPGAYLHLCIGAANRDPQIFPEPDRFDVARTPNHHLAFAAGGHACAGMSVARLEGQIAIQQIIRRFPRLRFNGEGVRNARARFRGFRSLPLATH